MAAPIVYLKEFDVDVADLESIRDKQMLYSVSLHGPPLSELVKLDPKERLCVLRSQLRESVKRIKGAHSFERFEPSNKREPWSIDVTSDVKTFVEISKSKCVVVDERKAFVTSANFTDRGQTRNIEAGVS